MSWVVFQSARPIWAETASLVRSLVPQSPLHELPQPRPVLLDERLVEAELLALRTDRRGGGSRDWRSLAVGSKVARTNAKVRNDATRMTGIE